MTVAIRSALPVQLVPAELEHTRFLYELYARPPVMHALGLKLPIQAGEWRRVIQGVWDGWKDCWIVKQGDLLIGHVGLQDRVDIDRRAEIGLAIDPTRHGRGIGTKALALAIERCDALGLELLIARVREDNAAARALFLRFGFVETGRIPRYYREAVSLVAQAIFSRTPAKGS